MHYLLTILFAFAASGAISNAVAQQPDLPDGFSWQPLEEISATFLIPDDWHFLSQQEDGTYAFFITEQNIQMEEGFSIGLSVNAVPNADEISGVAAQEYALAHIRAASQLEGIEVIHTWSGTQGPLHSFGMRYKSLNPAGEMVVIHQLNVGNEETGTFYLIMFEAPEQNWEDAWTKGETMMNIFSINPEV